MIIFQSLCCNDKPFTGDVPCDGIVYEPETKKYAIYTGEEADDATGRYAYKKTCKRFKFCIESPKLKSPELRCVMILNICG